MRKKVLILSSSPRKNSNSEALAEAFFRGAEESGHAAELLRLRDIQYGFCRGCLACQTSRRCVLQDGAAELVQKAGEADTLVFATPVYFYSVSGQLKTALDRLNPLYGTDYAFREVVLLATAAEDETDTVRGALKAVQGWVDCFPQVEITGVVFAGGVNLPGEVQGHPALRTAYEMGKAL